MTAAPTPTESAERAIQVNRCKIPDYSNTQRLVGMGYGAMLFRAPHPSMVGPQTIGAPVRAERMCYCFGMSRSPSNSEKVGDFLRFVGAHARGGRVFLTGGASAVIIGWRDLTVDVDLKLDPEPAGAFESIARAKEALDMNVELAAPDDFIPALPDWRKRSQFIARHGTTDFFHYDFYAQALSKIARGYSHDRLDVEAMHRLELIELDLLAHLFEAIEPDLNRYPAIAPQRFRQKVESALVWLTENRDHHNSHLPSP